MDLRVGGRPAWQWGTLATWSFYHPHHLSAFGGGAVVSLDEEWQRRVARALGMAPPLRASVRYPPSRELVQRYRIAEPAEEVEASLAGASKRLGLYVHVPFCERRCRYCDYATLPLSTHADRIDEYVEALVLQLEAVSRSLPGVEVAGLDIGGGTPRVLSPRHFERILDTARSHLRLAPSFEASTETTPVARRRPREMDRDRGNRHRARERPRMHDRRQ